MRLLPYILYSAAACAALLFAPPDADACSVSLDGRQKVALHGGEPRSNPDGSLYPGDAFRYEFEYHFSADCISPKFHGVRASGALIDEDGNGLARVGRSGTISGTALVDPDEGVACASGSPTSGRPDCGKLEAEISAKERVCRTILVGNDTSTVCWHRYHGDSAAISPRVVPTQIELTLERRALKDADGYDTVNLDGTYYVWDPIGVRHIADFKWKGERAGTISFDYAISSGSLAVEAGHECAEPNCQVAVSQPERPAGNGWIAVNEELGNGDGMYVYTASTPGDTGLHALHYEVTVKNLGSAIGGDVAQMEVEVAPYRPVFDSYAYTVLEEGSDRAYDSGHAVALRYFGSCDGGILHEERRGKISSYSADTVSRSQAAVNPPLTIPPDLLDWLSIEEIGRAKESLAGYSARCEDGSSRGDAGFDSAARGSLVSLGEHATFVKSGYAKITFGQEIADLLLGPENANRWYHNTTTVNTLASESVGGQAALNLTSYVYQYPHDELGFWVNATAYKNGEVDETVPLALTVGPSLRGGAEATGEYLAGKALYDTADEGFAHVVREDVPPTSHAASGDGRVSVWTIKPTVAFSGETASLVTGLAEVLPEGAGRYDVALYDVWKLPTGIEMTLQAADRSLSLAMPVFHGGGHHEAVDINEYAEIPSYRTGADGQGREAWFTTPHGFGPVWAEVNGGGREFVGSCADGCTVTVGHGPASVTLQNQWNGTATFSVPRASVQEDPGSIEEYLVGDVLEYVIFVAAIGGTFYLVVRSVKRVWRVASPAE